MVTRTEFRDKVRELCGTPFKHLGRTRNGVDCYGLPILAAEELGFAKREYYEVGGYNLIPGKKDLVDNIGKFLIARPFKPNLNHRDQVFPGDILVFRIDDAQVSRHIGIYTHTDDQNLMYMVHADMRYGRVLETRITATPWQHRLNQVWYVPELTED
jgi:hypothetical protein